MTLEERGSGEKTEGEPGWLKRLYGLNAVIAPWANLGGKSLYDHLQDDFAGQPPLPKFRAKRERFSDACRVRSLSATK